MRRDVGAARRLVAQHGCLEVSEDGHGHRARDGRRGHDQEVGGPIAPRAERVALFDAEPVLLVDDHEPEVGELDGLPEERVGADDDPGGPRGGLGEGEAPLRGALRTGDERDARGVGRGGEHRAIGERPHEFPQRPKVLRSQDLRGGEESRLAARVDDSEHRAERHHRLPRANVPLQEALHRHVAHKVGGDPLPHLPLARGQREREAPVERVGDPALGAASRHRPQARDLGTPPRERRLQDERLLVPQPRLAACRGLVVVGHVDVAEGRE